MTGESDLNVENYISEVKFGKYQLVTYFVILCLVLVCASSGNTYIFTARDTEYRCFVPECEKDLGIYTDDWLPKVPSVAKKCGRFANYNGSCEVDMFDNRTIIPCDRWVYGEGDAIVRSFGIECQDWKRSLVGTANGIGQIFSNLYSGFLSDKYGRRNVMLWMVFSAGIFGTIQSFSPSYWFFVICEFLNMAANSGSYSVAYVLAVEVLPSKYRIYGSSLVDGTYVISLVYLGILGWIIPSWRNLIRATNVPAFTAIFAFFVVSESPRWLFSKQRYKDCFKVLTNAAKMNKVDMSEKFKLEAIKHDDSSQIDNDNNETIFSIFFKEPRIRKRFLLCVSYWFSVVFVYYGLSFNSVNISRDESSVFLNYIYVKLIEVSGAIIYAILLLFFGRKIVLFSCLVSAGLFCVGYALSSQNGALLSLILYAFGNLSISMAYAILCLYTAELFPTKVRNSVVNICFVVGGISKCLTPYVPLLAKIHKSLPTLVYGIIPVGSSFLIFMLPETKDQKLPDNVDDIQ